MSTYLKYIFLVAAAVALMAGFFFLKKGTSINDDYVVHVQKNVENELSLTRQRMKQILDEVSVSDGKPFTRLLKNDHYPYFLYKNDSLLLWSDYRYAFDYTSVPLDETELRVQETTQGKFMLLTEQRDLNGSNYKLIVLVKLYSLVNGGTDDFYLGYNQRLFAIPPRSLYLTETEAATPIELERGKPLFYVTPPDDAFDTNSLVPYQTLIFVLTAILFLGVFLVLFLRQPQHKYHYGLILLLLLAFIIISRWLMVRFSIPFVFTESAIFNPQQYPGSSFSPSVGDFLLNYLGIIIVLVYANSVYYRTDTYRRLIRNEGTFQLLVSQLLLLISYVVFYICFHELSSSYKSSFFSLDITRYITFDKLRIASVGVFVFLSSIYFLTTHLVVSVYMRLNTNRLAGLGLLLGSLLLMAGLMWLMRIQFELIYLIHVAYVLVLYLTRLPRSFYGFRYPTTIYYFVGALTTALMSTFVVHKQELQRDIQAKKEFARQLMGSNDLLTEFLLKGNNELIAKDSLIQNLFFRNTPLAREIIQQRIRTLFLNQYLNQYDVEIFSFDNQGAPLDNSESARSYISYRAEHGQPESSTTAPSLISESGEGVFRNYVSFVTVEKEGAPVGYIMLKLTQQRQMPPTRYSELVLDNKLTLVSDISDYSYAVFEAGRQVSSFGPCNYKQLFPQEALGDSSLYQEGVTAEGFRHVGFMTSNQRQIVVSSQYRGWKGILANFSFMYLVLVIVVTLTITGHALRYKLSEMRVTYSTKIQVMLNAAFILPLLIVLFIILKIIGNHYQQNQQQTQLDNTRNLSLNVVSQLVNFQQGKMSRAYFEEQIQQIAYDADLDITLYDTTGRMFLSSKPLLYETGLLSGLINPVAQGQIVEQKQEQVLLQESMGRKVYNSTYIGLTSGERSLMGVMSIPYFDSQPNLNRQIVDIVTSVLIVFMAMLLIFLFVSYLAANLLIDPLKVLTRKIGTTTLNQPNEPLHWQSNDEIGTLIKKYNQMLINLEMNKQAISNNEKQSAWREMARQVAHEIKNPLTPMKLTLQQLQRTIRRDDPNALEKIGKAMESVIEQIDNIGYIAQSFSDIARMPLPQIELFDITEVARVAGDDYQAQIEKGDTLFQADIQQGPLHVSGDRNQFTESITNLLKNAKQATTDKTSGEINLKLYAHNDNVLIEIQDNGSGIPQSIRSRVFLPNFTTREDGTGLNLALAKRIVEYAGGSIWFETDEGKGTTFFISVPLVRE